MSNYDPDQGSAREDLCRYLAACYYQPGPEFAEEKVFDSMLAAATRIHPDLVAYASRLGKEFAAEGAANLLLDYTRLFLGPNHIIAKPYGSVWLEQQETLMGESTVAVQALYREGGFEIDEGFRELPDHIAAELEFLYLLIFRENEAHQQGKPEEMAATVALRKRFLDEHLGRWVAPFTAAVRDGAQCAYYRQLAELTNRFVNMEAGKDQSSQSHGTPRPTGQGLQNSIAAPKL